MIDGGKIDVLKSGCPLLIFDIGVTLLMDFVEVEVVAVYLVAAIIGGIVNDDYLVVGVILCED